MFSKEKIVQRIEQIDQIMTMLRDLRASEMAELKETETKTSENQCEDNTHSEMSKS